MIEKVERKRHIGNDIVVIIFVDGDAQYAPDTIRSYFTRNLLLWNLILRCFSVV